MKKIIKTFDPQKQKEVRAGYILDGVYHRGVKNQHYMVKEKGYGIQVDILNQLVVAGVKTIKLSARTMDMYSDLITWVQKGKTKSYGHGKQIFLPVSLMRIVKRHYDF